MASCEWKVQELSRFHEPRDLSWPSIEAGILKKEAPIPGKEWMTRQDEGKEAKNKSFLLPFSLYRLSAEGVAQIKGVPSSKA